MTYPIVSVAQARKSVDLFWREGASADLSQFVSWVGTGQSEPSEIEMLGLLLRDLDPANSQFDALARPVVHQALSTLPEEALASPDFWRYLAAVRFVSVTQARHPKSRKSGSSGELDGNLANYGALRFQVTESLFFRLYTGADLALDENATDPYWLARIHDVDLWQSHIIRVLSGDNGAYARALLRWYNSRADWYAGLSSVDTVAIFAKYDKEPLSRHLRDLVKRVRRLRSNVLHELLSEAEILEMIEREALSSLQQADSWGKSR